MVDNTRDKWEAIKNGCPWGIQIETFDGENIAPEHNCRATQQDCHYKGCAIMYWFRHLMKPLFSKEELEEYKQYLEREKAFYR